MLSSYRPPDVDLHSLSFEVDLAGVIRQAVMAVEEMFCVLNSAVLKPIYDDVPDRKMVGWTSEANSGRVN